MNTLHMKRCTIRSEIVACVLVLSAPLVSHACIDGLCPNDVEMIVKTLRAIIDQYGRYIAVGGVGLAVIVIGAMYLVIETVIEGINAKRRNSRMIKGNVQEEENQ